MWDYVRSGLASLPTMLWPIVVIGGVIGLMALAVRGSRPGQTPFPDIQERFTRGETDRQDEARKGQLSQP